MRLLAEILGVRRAVEVGTFTGYSALCVAQALPPGGRLLFVEVHQTFVVTDDTEAGWRGADPQRSFKEFGTHVIDLCKTFFGERPIGMSARMPRPFASGGPDYLNLIRLEFSGDRVAQITLDRLTKGKHRYLDLRLVGEKGTIETSLGTFHCELYGDKTPMTVANFVGLATGKKPWMNPKTGSVETQKPFYDDLVFHRVIAEFMIQGGDPLGRGSGGPGYQFGDETDNGLKMEPGTLAMANAGPSTNGSQFFITETAPDWLNGKHTIFGKCSELEVVKSIARVSQNAQNKPDTPVTMKVIVRKG